MHPSFFEPAHRAEPTHPRPVGVKRIVKRNRPDRLDLSLPPPGFPAVVVTTAHRPVPVRHGISFRIRLGRLLIRLGHALAADNPVVKADGRS